jgi:hypothetical protein
MAWDPDHLEFHLDGERDSRKNSTIASTLVEKYTYTAQSSLCTASS